MVLLKPWQGRRHLLPGPWESLHFALRAGVSQERVIGGTLGLGLTAREPRQHACIVTSSVREKQTCESWSNASVQTLPRGIK